MLIRTHYGFFYRLACILVQAEEISRMLKILVTGCAGFIGSQLSARLLSGQTPLGPVEVHGVDCFDDLLYPSSLHRAQLLPLMSHPQFVFTAGDICDAALMSRLCSGMDWVVHLAALAGVRPSLQHPARYMRVNVEGTQRVLDACAKNGVRRIVFASSSSVYGVRSKAPFRESDPAVTPASPYAASKRTGELLCAVHSTLHPSAICALRLFTVYGPHQRPEMAIAKFARLIEAGAKVPLYGHGQSARDYTYIDDILDGIIAAIERTADPARGYWVYNLGGAQMTTLLDLVKLLETALGRRAEIDPCAEQPGDVPLTSADLSLAGAELGYAPKVTLAEGIDRYCQWLRQQTDAVTQPH
jgi:UDP-glucuronate 4-epimerase